MVTAQVNNWMLSNVNMGGEEGWRHLDALSLEESCPAEGGAPPSLVTRGSPGHPLPGFLHYCQNYRVADWIFAKRRVPPHVFTDCAHPFLKAPGLADTQVTYEMHPPGNPCREKAARKPLPTRGPVVNRTAAAVCLGTYYVNAAAKRARGVFCAGQPPPPPPVKMFDLAMQCGKKSSYNNARGGS